MNSASTKNSNTSKRRLIKLLHTSCDVNKSSDEINSQTKTIEAYKDV